MSLLEELHEQLLLANRQASEAQSALMRADGELALIQHNFSEAWTHRLWARGWDDGFWPSGRFYMHKGAPKALLSWHDPLDVHWRFQCFRGNEPWWEALDHVEGLQRSYPDVAALTLDEQVSAVAAWVLQNSAWKGWRKLGRQVSVCLRSPRHRDTDILRELTRIERTDALQHIIQPNNPNPSATVGVHAQPPRHP